MMSRMCVCKADPVSKKAIPLIANSTIKLTANTSAVKTSMSVWNPTPVVATTDVQDKEECVSVFANDDDITLTEEDIGDLF